jgi:hypothetical protein
MSARRCIHTGVRLPECSCLSCNREKVRRYAPALIADKRSAQQLGRQRPMTMGSRKR